MLTSLFERRRGKSRPLGLVQFVLGPFLLASLVCEKGRSVMLKERLCTYLVAAAAMLVLDEVAEEAAVRHVCCVLGEKCSYYKIYIIYI